MQENDINTVPGVLDNTSQIPSNPVATTFPSPETIIQPTASPIPELQTQQPNPQPTLGPTNSFTVTQSPSVYATPTLAPQIMPANQVNLTGTCKSGKRKWAKRILIITSLVALVGGGLAVSGHLNVKQAADTLQSPAPGQPYISSAYGFKITPPIGWYRTQEPPKGNLVGFQLPAAEYDGTSKFTPTIAVVGAELKSQSAQNLTLAQFVDSSTIAISRSYANYRLISSTPEEISGTPATLIVYSVDRGQENGTAATLFIIYNHKAFSVNGLTLSSTWSTHQEAIKKSLLSFQLNP